ncbi:ZPR1 zinc finger domain-containing protein [Candidatus Woesearchaeota archaeon]|nr:ZPR1 zinc finger domain-containing protein [Candidatus Woesearchaeota archaeon]
MNDDFNIDVLEGEQCPFCKKNTLTLREAEREIPFFGRVVVFSMDCENEECGYHKADVEALDNKPAVKCSLVVSSKDDLKVRVIKSSFATIVIPRIGSIEPGEASNGYVTNVEGIINRIKRQVEFLRDNAEDDSERKKAKNMVKKLTKVLMGQEEITINLNDPSGNSAIISDKTVKK